MKPLNPPASGVIEDALERNITPLVRCHRSFDTQPAPTYNASATTLPSRNSTSKRACVSAQDSWHRYITSGATNSGFSALTMSRVTCQQFNSVRAEPGGITVSVIRDPAVGAMVLH